jgi:hypothetical protein
MQQFQIMQSSCLTRVIIFCIAIILLVLFAFIVSSHSQELPEPSMPAITYEYEIAWGSKPLTVWTAITPTPTTFVNGLTGTHIYYGALGDNKFEFECADSTVAIPKKAVIILNINIPSNKLFDFFRIHVRASATFDGSVVTSAWSDPSYWVLVMNLKKLNYPVSIK